MKRVVLAAHNAYVVRLDARGVSLAAERGGIAGSRYVRWLGPLQPACRISPAARGGRVLLDLLPHAVVSTVAAGAGGTRTQVVTIAFEGSCGRNGADRPASATACASQPIGPCP